MQTSNYFHRRIKADDCENGGRAASRLNSLTRVSLVCLLGAVRVAAAANATPGIDCGCNAVGQYVKPEVKPLSLGASGASPNGHYTARLVQSGLNHNLEVRRVSDGQRLVVVVNVPTNVAYGFSPNSGAFVYFGIRNQGSIPDATIELYNLAGATSFPVSPVWQHPDAVNVGFGFSPHGRYFVLNEVRVGNTSRLRVIDSANGTVALDENLNYYIAPIDDFDAAGWGFSRDALDRSFVLARITDQTTGSLKLRNLVTRQTVISRTLSGPSHWRFSPCGEVFGLVEENNSTGVGNVRLANTLDGSQIANRTVSGLETITLSVNSDSHTATIGNNSNVLAPNAANDACFDNNNVWVDFAHSGTERGTFDAPYRTLNAAVGAVSVGGNVIIKAASRAETLTINKPVTIQSFGGTATIGQ